MKRGRGGEGGGEKRSVFTSQKLRARILYGSRFKMKFKLSH